MTVRRAGEVVGKDELLQAYTAELTPNMVMAERVYDGEDGNLMVTSDGLAGCASGGTRRRPVLF